MIDNCFDYKKTISIVFVKNAKNSKVQKYYFIIKNLENLSKHK